MNRVYLVRHGENPANLTHEFSHRKVNHPLTDKGRLQAKQTAEWFSRIKLDEVWSSPLRRALETADQIVRFHPVPVMLLEEFREMNVGNLEGPASEEAWKTYHGVMREWFAGNSDVAFPGGESRRSLVLRFRRGLEHITRAKNGKTLVVVGHGGLFTHGVAELCGIADQRAFFAHENHNGSISELEVHREGNQVRYVLRAWANIGHLTGEAAQFVESVPEAYRISKL